MLKWLGDAYCWVWYHWGELWGVAKELRRPFTYWMRDMSIDHPLIFWPIVALLTVVAYIIRTNFFGFLYTFFLAMLLSHLFWGKPVQYGEQEDPPYIED
jgi:hypothetical protein